MRVQIGAHLLTVHIHSSQRIGSGDNGKRMQAGSADIKFATPYLTEQSLWLNGGGSYEISRYGDTSGV